MSDSGYRGFIRGLKGSTAEHLSDIEFKAKKEREKKLMVKKFKK